jgi:hypothetical protein
VSEEGACGICIVVKVNQEVRFSQRPYQVGTVIVI